MTVTNDLLRFVRTHREELTLSVYVEATPSDPAARRNWRVVLRQQIAAVRERLAAAPQEERDAFERCAERALDRLGAEQFSPGATGWACFCAAGGDELHLAVPPGVGTSVHWGTGARVVPYLRVAEADEALVVQLDREHARLSRLHDGNLETLLTLEAEEIGELGPFMGEGPRPGFHSGTHGRTGTDEAQRLQREASDRLLAGVLRRLTTLADSGLPLVVGGAPESAAHLFRQLPAAYAERSALATGLRMTPPAESLPAIHEALHALRLRHQEARLDALREAAHRNGRAALGLEVANRAAQSGAIAELIFSEQAWRRHPQEIEALVQRALADGAEVAWADPAVMRDLDGEADGIVAGLRFPLASTA